jgi:hypothetical protein
MPSNYESLLIKQKPFFMVDVTGGFVSEIAKVLRAGRSHRILGIVRSEVYSRATLTGKTLWFFCDALDNDSIMLCPADFII